MKIDLDFTVKQLNGKDFIEKEQDGVDEKGQPKFKDLGPFTIRKICTDALIGLYQDEEKLGAKIKAARGWLAMRIHNHKETTIELTADDITMLKDLVAKRYTPLIIAQTWEILDPASKK